MMHGFIFILGVCLCLPSAHVCMPSDSTCTEGQQCSQCGSDDKCLSECFVGYYGSQCNHRCSHGCLNNTCSLNTQSGVSECSHGCQLGLFGRSCKVPCITSSPGCKRCASGCVGSYCVQNDSCWGNCVDSYFGSQCKSCSKQCELCNYTTGECQRCTSGYTGGKCEHVCHNCSGHCTTAQCTTCLTGYYGQLCGDTCSINCDVYSNSTSSSPVQCDKTSGECKYGCKRGWYGEKCNETCSRGCYHRECDQKGECEHGCALGYYGPGCIQCHPGCHGTCDTHSGHCADGCKKGYYGLNCSLHCGSCVTSVCEQQTGLCVVGCNSTYDNDCDKLCKRNCSTSDICQTPKWCSDAITSSTTESELDTKVSVEPNYILDVGITLAVLLLIVIVLLLLLLLRKATQFCPRPTFVSRRRLSNGNDPEHAVVVEEMRHMDTRYEPLHRYWEINYSDMHRNMAASSDDSQSPVHPCEGTHNASDVNERATSDVEPDIGGPRNDSEKDSRGDVFYERYLSPCMPEPLS
ncbi:multiple epidermal growth factor-like domains protein 6 [Haliotis cracherodii]|uniref:multiple epidermal growth factor-like domains protein 6 n=1 Tax=Haliotis cracherodii TaxID=6455 RepID=UPI0039EA8F1A